MELRSETAKYNQPFLTSKSSAFCLSLSMADECKTACSLDAWRFRWVDSNVESNVAPDAVRSPMADFKAEFSFSTAFMSPSRLLLSRSRRPFWNSTSLILSSSCESFAAAETSISLNMNMIIICCVRRNIVNGWSTVNLFLSFNESSSSVRTCRVDCFSFMRASVVLFIASQLPSLFINSCSSLSTRCASTLAAVAVAFHSEQMIVNDESLEEENDKIVTFCF